MTSVLNLEKIKEFTEYLDLVQAMEEGFIAYSYEQTVVPPVGELLFDEPKGDAHIKYGYIKNDDYYVVKNASGFYDNPSLGLASSQGLMLLFDQKTGVPKAVLLDEGYLTDLRTAAAGALAAKYFAPEQVQAIGIVGTGIQAKWQLEMLKSVSSCRNVYLWGRNQEKTAAFAASLGTEWTPIIAKSPDELARKSNLIVTCTPAEVPLIPAAAIQPGTHITAVGSDTPHKQELEAGVFIKASLVIADSLNQSKSRGEIFKATQAGTLEASRVVELGKAIQSGITRKESDITVVDLTGVAVQDIMIAKAVYHHYKTSTKC